MKPELVLNGLIALFLASGNGHLQAGIALYEKGEYERAIAEFVLEVKEDNHSAEAYYYHGLSYLALGNAERAESSFKIALCLASDAGNLEIYNKSYLAYRALLDE